MGLLNEKLYQRTPGKRMSNAEWGRIRLRLLHAYNGMTEQKHQIHDIETLRDEVRLLRRQLREAKNA